MIARIKEWFMYDVCKELRLAEERIAELGTVSAHQHVRIVLRRLRRVLSRSQLFRVLQHNHTQRQLHL